MGYRSVQQLKNNWRFCIDGENIGLDNYYPELGLPNARKVTVPHTWNIDPHYETYRGKGWYEYKFEAPSEWKGKNVKIHFEAVYRDADIWLNGKKLGKHYNSGYTAFELEMTAALKFDTENMLIVSVDNSYSESAFPFRNSFDWADDGGIFREVYFIVTGRISIDTIKILPEPIWKDSSVDGSVSIEAVISGNIENAFAYIEISRKGSVVYKTSKQITSQIVKINDIILNNIDLWHFDHPDLYSVSLIVEADRQPSDEVIKNIGFREIRVEGNKIIFNGEAVRLTGVEWMPGSNPEIGTAESKEQIHKTLEQMKNSNCVLTRFHWQQDDEIFDWCDKNGILVQEEIPHWQMPAVPDEKLLSLSRQHATEMITNHYNHPSIIAWGMGNELDAQVDKTNAYMKDLKEKIKELDSSRLINYVSNQVFRNPRNDASTQGDVIMWNEYSGTWFPEAELGGSVEYVTHELPEYPVVISEFGLCQPAYSGGDSRRINDMHEHINTYRQHEGIAGFIYFCLNDYRTQMGEDGEGRLKQRVHGVTNMTGIPKRSYFELTKECSPIQINSILHRHNGVLSVEISVRNDLPAYTVSGYTMAVSDLDGNAIAKAFIPRLEPGSSSEIMIDAAVEKGTNYLLSVWRPTGFKVLEVTI